MAGAMNDIVSVRVRPVVVMAGLGKMLGNLVLPRDVVLLVRNIPQIECHNRQRFGVSTVVSRIFCGRPETAEGLIIQTGSLSMVEIGGVQKLHVLGQTPGTIAI